MTTRRPKRPLLRWLVSLLLLAVLAGGATLYAEVRSMRSRGLPFLADVFVRSPNGDVRQLTPGDGIYHFASIRRDAARVVYEGGSTGCSRLWVMDLESGEAEPITPADSAALHPNYSWDGRQIVFISDRDVESSPLQVEQIPMFGMYGDHHFNVFVMDAESGETRKLTSGPYQDFRPSFSPDGKTIVFSSDRSGPGPYRLWSVAADGSGAPEPMSFTGPAYNAWYAVDGESVFFHTFYQGRERSVRLTIGEERPVLLPNDRFERTHGEFADPNGEVLLVHAVHEGEWGMWELPLDGSPARSAQVPGLENGMHGSRSLDGTLVFDVERYISFRRELAWRLRRLLD